MQTSDKVHTGSLFGLDCSPEHTRSGGWRAAATDAVRGSRTEAWVEGEDNG